jgi:OmpA-OmpF porin, OOP family
VVRSSFAALAACVLCAMPAMSQDKPSTKFYASADLGTAENGVSEYVLGTPEGPRDEKSNVIRVRFGYQFVRFFALEAGYADLGNYSANIDMDCSSAPQVECVPDFRSDLDISAWTINGAGALPIGERFALRANIGFALRTKKTHLVPVEGDDVHRTSQKLLPCYGVGANFAITKKIDVFAEWSKFAGDEVSMGSIRAPGGLIDESDLEALSLGVRFRF